MSNKCASCGQTVYFAEQLIALNKTWHKRCFKCTGGCGKVLQGGAYCENGGMPYCKACYGSKHGPKVYGFGAPGSADGIKLDVTGGSVAKPETQPPRAASQPAKPASAAPVPAANTEDPLVQLEKLATLRDKGIITDAEFQAKKKQLLGL